MKKGLLLLAAFLLGVGGTVLFMNIFNSPAKGQDDTAIRGDGSGVAGPPQPASSVSLTELNEALESGNTEVFLDKLNAYRTGGGEDLKELLYHEAIARYSVGELDEARTQLSRFVAKSTAMDDRHLVSIELLDEWGASEAAGTARQALLDYLEQMTKTHPDEARDTVSAWMAYFAENDDLDFLEALLRQQAALYPDRTARAQAERLAREKEQEEAAHAEAERLAEIKSRQDSRPTERIRSIDIPDERIDYVEWSPDGRYILSAARGSRIFVWDAQTGTLFRNFKNKDATRTTSILGPWPRKTATWCPESRRIIFLSQGSSELGLGWVAVYDIESQSLRNIFEISTSPSDFVRGRDSSTNEPAKWFSGRAFTCIAVSPNDDYIAVGNYESEETWAEGHHNDFSSRINVLNRSTGREVHDLRGHSEMIYEIAFSPDGSRLASLGSDNRIIIWSRDGNQIRTIDAPSDLNAQALCWSPDGQRIVSAWRGSDSDTGLIRVNDLETGDPIQSSLLGGAPASIAYRPTGDILAVGMQSGVILLIDTRTGDIDQNIWKYALQPASGVSWSPDGRYLAVARQIHGVEIFGPEGTEASGKGLSEPATESLADGDGQVEKTSSAQSREVQGAAIEELFQKALKALYWDLAPTAEVFGWLEKAAEEGNPVARAEVANSYWRGTGVSQDRELAKRLAEEATPGLREEAEAGDAHAQYLLGFYFGSGLHSPRDYEAAIEWYRRAAEQGHALGQNNLGMHYYLGLGAGEDQSEAVRWYRMAAEQGLSTSQYNLGHAYLYGNGTGQDESEGIRWLEAATNQGNRMARDLLAEWRESADK